MALKYKGGRLSALGDAQDWLVATAGTKKGARCPCCHLLAKVWKRTVTGSMAHALVLVAGETKKGECDPDWWIHIPSLLSRKASGATARGGDYTKLKYWGLLEKLPGKGTREDGSPRKALWRITSRGLRFVMNEITIDKYVFTYDDTIIDRDTRQVGIVDCLGKKFDYQEILGG